MDASTALTALYLVILVALALYGFHRSALVCLYYRNRHRKPVASGTFAELPAVTVQLPLFNEMYVVERLLDAVSALRYPRDRFQIQVLDDSTDETQDICRRKIEQLIVKQPDLDIEYVHRVDRTGFKAGALENGLRTAKGELVLIFDADFVPNPDILERTEHHFLDPKDAVVQCRWEHINRDFSALTEAQALMLDGHFIMEHAGRNRSGRFFNFNGTAGLWRRSAIVDAGGWQHDTLTEDMDLSYRAQLRGWRFVYLPEIAALIPLAKLRGELLADAAATLVNPPELDDYIRGWRYTADSVGLLVCGRPMTALRALAGLLKEGSAGDEATSVAQRRDQMRDSPAMRELVSFMLGDDYGAMIEKE